MARIGTQTNIQLFSCHVSLKSTNNQKYNLKYRSHFHTPHEFDECHGRCLSDANTHKIADIVWYHQGGATGRWHANFCLTPFFNIQFSSNDLVRQSLTKKSWRQSVTWMERISHDSGVSLFLRFGHWKTHPFRSNSRKQITVNVWFSFP